MPEIDAKFSNINKNIDATSPKAPATIWLSVSDEIKILIELPVQTFCQKGKTAHGQRKQLIFLCPPQARNEVAFLYLRFSERTFVMDILGYSFKNKSLIKIALTHSSYGNEKQCKCNERLEFLGDSVLSIIISEYLFLNPIADMRDQYLPYSKPFFLQ